MNLIIIKWFLDKFGLPIVKFFLDIVKKYYTCLICGSIGGCIVIFAIAITLTAKKHYIKAQAVRYFQSIIENQKNLVEKCATQNCLGIAEIESNGLRFIQIWCKDSPKSEPFELTHIKNHWYSNENVKVVNQKNDLFGALHLLKNNEIIGVAPLINKVGGACDYSMYIVHKPNQINFAYNPQSFLGDGNFQKSRVLIPFFTEQVFPNLNTKCSPKYNALYSETDFSVIWLTHYDMKYFIWWSFKEEGKCQDMVTRQDIFIAIQNLSNKLGENYTKINWQDIFSL